MNNSHIAILCVGGIFLLGILLFSQYVVNSIEQELQDRTSEKILASGFPRVVTVFDGAVVSLHGVVSDPAQAARVLSVVESVQGVRFVINNIRVVDKDDGKDKAEFRIHKDTRKLILIGTVPEGGSRLRFVNHVAKFAGELKVINFLKEEGLPLDSSWQKIVETMLEAMIRLRIGEASISGYQVIISGTASDGVEEQSIQQFLSQNIQTPYELSIELSTPIPLAQPYMFSLEKKDESFVMGVCMGPDDSSLKEIELHLKDMGVDVEEGCFLRSGVPNAAWGDVVKRGLDNLNQLETGILDIQDNTVTLEGIISEDENLVDVQKSMVDGYPSWYFPRISLKSKPKAASPYTFSAVKNGDRVRFGGNVSTLTIKNKLLALVQNGMAYDLRIKSGAPEDWEEAVIRALEILNGISEGLLLTKGTHFEITGIGDRNQRSQFLKKAEDAPKGYKFDMRFYDKNSSDALRAIAYSTDDTLIIKKERNGSVIIAGGIPDELMRKTILAYASAKFDNIKLREGLYITKKKRNSDWYEIIFSGINIMSHLRDGVLYVYHSTVEIEGHVSEPNSVIAVNQTILKNTWHGAHILSKITVEYVEKLSGKECELALNEAVTKSKIVFNSGSVKINDSTSDVLDIVASITKQCALSCIIEIAGYTDSVGDNMENLKLSMARAEMIRKSLQNRGVDGNLLIARGYGESDPIADNDSHKGQIENRRIEFRVLQ